MQLAIYLLYLLHLSSLSSLVTFANSLSLSSAQAIPLSLLCCHWPVPVPRPHLSLSLIHCFSLSRPSLVRSNPPVRTRLPGTGHTHLHTHLHTYTPTEWLWSPPAVLLSAAVCCCCRHCRARLTATSVAITQTDRQTEVQKCTHPPLKALPRLCLRSSLSLYLLPILFHSLILWCVRVRVLVPERTNDNFNRLALPT